MASKRPEKGRYPDGPPLKELLWRIEPCPGQIGRGSKADGIGSERGGTCPAWIVGFISVLAKPRVGFEFTTAEHDKLLVGP